MAGARLSEVSDQAYSDQLLAEGGTNEPVRRLSSDYAAAGTLDNTPPGLQADHPLPTPALALARTLPAAESSSEAASKSTSGTASAIPIEPTGPTADAGEQATLALMRTWLVPGNPNFIAVSKMVVADKEAECIKLDEQHRVLAAQIALDKMNIEREASRLREARLREDTRAAE